MKKLLVILFILALPAFSSAGDFVVGPGPSTAAPKSFLSTDIFVKRMHACETGGSSCKASHLVASTFVGVVEVDVVVAQAYDFLFVLLDTEGAVVRVNGDTLALGPGTQTVNTTFSSVPGSSDAATRGLYRLIVIVQGANGQTTLSPYFEPIRVLP